jgi:hypothetical protein
VLRNRSGDSNETHRRIAAARMDRVISARLLARAAALTNTCLNFVSSGISAVAAG